MLTLLLGRWILGFFFPHGDLELLDNPLPKKLYCRRFREESPTKDIEVGLEETDNDALDSESQPIEMNEIMTSEPETGDQNLSARNALFGANKSSEFNITEEMDNCDLWKNLVKNYDAPPQSPRQKNNESSRSVVIQEEKEESTKGHYQSNSSNSKPSACRRLELYQSTAV